MEPFKAMILAAGHGTRLRPLTLNRPKVLVPVQNRPLLHWLVEYLGAAGAEAVIVNAHHLSTIVVEYIARENFAIPVKVRVEKTLLGTGGGIGNVGDFWDSRPFVVINGDILSWIDLQAVLRSHKRSCAIATLVLVDEPRFNRVQVADDGRILSFSGGSGPHLAFTGIQVLTPEVLSAIPAGTPASIINSYVQLIGTGRKVMAHVVQGQFWRELGSLDRYLEAHEEFFRLESAPIPGLQVGGKPVIHPSARLGSGVRLDGMVCIGAGCHLDNGVVVQGSIIWEQVQVRAGCSVRRSVIADRVIVEGSVRNEILVA